MHRQRQIQGRWQQKARGRQREREVSCHSERKVLRGLRARSGESQGLGEPRARIAESRERGQKSQGTPATVAGGGALREPQAHRSGRKQ